MSLSEKSELVLDLPYPPSVNHYWRSNRGIVHISKEGILYRQAIKKIIRDLHAQKRMQMMKCYLAVDVMISPPDDRRRDIDNICKSLLDALAHAGIYEDDSQIVDLRLRKLSKVQHGKVQVGIREVYVEAGL